MRRSRSRQKLLTTGFPCKKRRPFPDEGRENHIALLRGGDPDALRCQRLRAVLDIGGEEEQSQPAGACRAGNWQGQAWQFCDNYSMWFRRRDWCCSGFETYYENAGCRGQAYLVHRDHRGEPAFTLQFRAVDKGVGADVDRPYRITRARFSYCPSCGTKRSKFYRDRIDELYRPDLLLHESWPPTDE